jgi:hypothetical protein
MHRASALQAPVLRAQYSTANNPRNVYDEARKLLVNHALVEAPRGGKPISSCNHAAAQKEALRARQNTPK